ncbi:MAG: hypothetical protein JAZ06_03565 [Candidatus Thiodiazotropha taylori]|nr:hypothetical protein [Candidatus Thiodiazotropha taylori]
MKHLKIASIIGLFSVAPVAYPDSITDNYANGDTLSASTLDNIKSAVNDNDSRVTALESALATLQATVTDQAATITTLQADLAEAHTTSNDANINANTANIAAIDARISTLEPALAAHLADWGNPHAVSKAQVGLQNVENIRVNYTATTAPTTDDDINNGYSVGSVWIDTALSQAYILLDSTSGAAVWQQVINTYSIGQRGPAGGIVFYVTDGGTNGLEAAPADLPISPWGCLGTSITGADATAIGTGSQNTNDIIAGCATSGIAARLVDAYTLNGYSDWYLPSENELLEFFSNPGVVGGLIEDIYLSSTEIDSDLVFCTLGGGPHLCYKFFATGVRAIRAF